MKPHKSSSHYLCTGEPNKVVALTKSEHQKVQAAVNRLGLNLGKQVHGMTRAEREARSRERQLRFAAARQAKAEVRP